MIYTVVLFLICFGTVALGLWAAWQSGKDVGYRNAMRDADVLHDDTRDTVLRHDNKE
nr:MAG TPA: hypothetical protein [Caudoviricetes sp.]